MSSEQEPRWLKRGLVVIEPGEPAAWRASHAALPAVDLSDPRQAVLYLSTRDEHGRSSIACGRLTFDGSGATVALGSQPALSPGRLGAFDDSGVTMSCIVAVGPKRFLYYTGWARGITVPFYLHAGLALSEDEGQNFTRLSPAPLLDRNAVDPFLTASPWVLHEDGRWQMWYVSATEWTAGPAGPRHHYHIRYAESADGIHWDRAGQVCIDFASVEEHAFGRPCVVRERDGHYRMWYSVRGDAYRIGYAVSPDGVRWTRQDDQVGIDVSPDGWDSQMIEYPVVFDHDRRRLMLYNGNDYGRTGIGLAERE